MPRSTPHTAASAVATTPSAPNANPSTVSVSTTSPNPPSPSSDFSHPGAPSTFTDALPLPSTLVFDLDYTLWPFWIDTHCTPPLRAQPSGHSATDRRGQLFTFYPEVPGILAAARARGLRIAAASRTCAPDLARELLGMLMVRDDGAAARSGDGKGKGTGAPRPAREFFDDLQIYPGDKVRHVDRIARGVVGAASTSSRPDAQHAGANVHGKKEASGRGGSAEAERRACAEMLFFDDEERNRNVERERGVCFQLVRDGVSRAEVDRGVRRWREARGKAAAAGAHGTSGA